MISLHRFGPRGEPILVNPDLIASVEACPDTVVSLTTGRRLVVAETPDEVAEATRAWRGGILAMVPDAALVTGDGALKSAPSRPMTRKDDVERFAAVVAQ